MPRGLSGARKTRCTPTSCDRSIVQPTRLRRDLATNRPWQPHSKSSEKASASPAAALRQSFWVLAATGFFTCSLVLGSASSAHAQCPPIPSGGGQSIDGSVTRVDNSCPVTSGKYILKGTQTRVDILATADGSCLWMLTQLWPPPLHCVPWDSPTNPEQRTINHGNVFGLDLNNPTLPQCVFSSQQPIPTRIRLPQREHDRAENMVAGPSRRLRHQLERMDQ